MNQILITGEEYGKQPKKQKQEYRPKQPKTEKKVFGINGIVIFYAISVMILGICMITGSVYARGKINETVEANTKPLVEVTQNDANNTVEINATHIRKITEISYKWNDEEEQTVQGNNQNQLKTSIDLIGGTNTLTVKVTEENGQSVTYKKEITAQSIAEIELEAVSNGVKLIVTSEKQIEHITYNWDGGEEQKINVGQNKYEGIINAPKGKHTLKIEVVDINNAKETKTQLVVGDTEPTVNVTADIVNEKLVFVIDAEDDENIETVEITLNDGTKQVIDVNEKTYHAEVEMTQGENKLLVTVYNVNGLSTTIGRKYKN